MGKGSQSKSNLFQEGSAPLCLGDSKTGKLGRTMEGTTLVFTTISMWLFSGTQNSKEKLVSRVNFPTTALVKLYFSHHGPTKAHYIEQIKHLLVWVWKKQVQIQTEQNLTWFEYTSHTCPCLTVLCLTNAMGQTFAASILPPCFVWMFMNFTSLQNVINLMALTLKCN